MMNIKHIYKALNSPVLSYKEFKTDVKYLREKLGVRVSTQGVSFKTKQITIEGFYFGRFDVKYKTDSKLVTFYNCSKNKKHPHTDVSPEKEYKYTCVGEKVIRAYHDGRYYDAYRLTNIMASSIDYDDAADMSNYHHDNILEACSNFELCTTCMDGIYYNHDCGNRDCCASSLYGDLDDI